MAQHLDERDRVIVRLELRIEKITDKITRLHDEINKLQLRQEELIDHVRDYLTKKKK